VAKQRYSVGEVVEALEQSNGLITQAAARLGCSRGTIHNYAARYPTVAETLKWKRLELIDAAMSALIDAVERGETWAILFTLRTFGGPEWNETPQQIAPSNVVRFMSVIETRQTDGSSTYEEIGPMGSTRSIAG
jgi:hypothetical protein